ncbi:hypothetical protein [Peribacillus glennii]|nr:hypothetical protein [Peribacillus glennii]
MDKKEFLQKDRRDRNKNVGYERSPIPAERSVDRSNDPAGLRGGDSRGI